MFCPNCHGVFWDIAYSNAHYSVLECESCGTAWVEQEKKRTWEDYYAKDPNLDHDYSMNF